MTSSDWDVQGWIEVFKRLEMEEPPVGVSFLTHPPDGIAKLGDQMRLCQMLKHAQTGNVFYADPENHTCGAGLYILGKDLPSVYTSGEYGAGLQVFDSLRAASRLYDQIPRLNIGRNINYILFSPLEKLTFSPDLLIVLAQAEQTEILLRALSYSTGKMWVSKSTGVIGCAWAFVYPYLTGDLNYMAILSLGMRALKLFPPGRQLISIPSELLPMMLDNLRRMPLVLPALQPGGDEFRRNLLIQFGLDPTH
jgi:uncharacterized protein (DUF169 family)